MDKMLSLEKLFNNLKDNLEFDSDVIAITKLLNALFILKKEEAIGKWQSILEKYDIAKLEVDIDFTPLIKDFPAMLFQELELETFLNIVDNTLVKEKIYLNVFNTLEIDSALNKKVKTLIKAKDEKKEKEFILEIVKYQNKFPKLVFDLNTLLQNVILSHLKNADCNLKLLEEYTEIPANIKDKTLLKVLLIDYL